VNRLQARYCFQYSTGGGSLGKNEKEMTMKAMIGALLVVVSATAFSVLPGEAAGSAEPYFWKGFRYQIGPFYGCWTIRYGQQGWNNNCDCEFVQRVVLRNGKRTVQTVRECSNR
jgi:hypothetical protein